jgi:O-antigen ligase
VAPPALPRPGPPAALSTSTVLLVGHALLVVVVSSWWGGGRAEHSAPLILALSAAGLPLLWLRHREGGRIRWLALLPAALWCGFVAIAVANPTHLRMPDGSWQERADWVRWLPRTADPARTLASTAWLAALLEGGLLVAAGLPGRAVRGLWVGVALNGFALAAVGAAFHFAGADLMLGRHAVPEPTYFFATFYYKNHWAAYGALGALAGTALALEALPAALAGSSSARGRAFLFGGTAVLTLCSLPLPGSRAGLLLATAILLALAGRIVVQPARNRHVRLGALVAVLGIAASGASFYAARARADLARTQQQVARHAAGGMLDLRLELSRDTWRMAQARPWLGWGVGTFEIVFPVFQGDYLRDTQQRPLARFEFAHNDWLQLLAEGGIIGGALLLLPAGLRWRRAWREGGAAGRWIAGGALLVAAYAWIDFPFHNPAVLLLWTVLVATAPPRESAA